MIRSRPRVIHVFFIQKPSMQAIEEFLVRQQEQSFSYPELGATREQVPTSYTIDHNRVQLGTNKYRFETASQSLQHWEMFNLGWVQVYPPTAPIKIDTTINALIRHFGFYSLNAARIVY